MNETLENKIRALIEKNFNSFHQIKQKLKRIGYLETFEEKKNFLIDQAVRELNSIAIAIQNDYTIWAECIKESNAKSWYELYYLSIEDNKPKKNKFFSVLFMDFNATMNYYCFSSNGIGTPRKIDSTDIVFQFLRECGIKYIQL